MEALSEKKSNRILFIQTAFIGDAILSLPAIEKLKELNPDNIVDVLCIPQSKEIFEASPFVDNVIVLEKRGKHKSLIATYKFAGKLRENNYSKVYSSHRSFRTALIIIQLQVKETFGFDNSSLFHVYKNLIEYKSDKHEVQRNLDLIGFNYDDKSWKIAPKIKYEKNIEDKIEAYLKEIKFDDGFISIAPGSVWKTKIYPAEYFEEIIKYLLSKDHKVILIGGDADKSLCESIKNKFEKNVINSAGAFSIIESAALLTKSKLLITNDSAPTHLGMVAGVKVLTVYCSTIPEFGFYPYIDNSFFISKNDIKCKPCGIHGYTECPKNNFECGLKLTPDIMIEKIEEMLIGE